MRNMFSNWKHKEDVYYQELDGPCIVTLSYKENKVWMRVYGYWREVFDTSPGGFKMVGKANTLEEASEVAYNAFVKLFNEV